MEAGSRLPGQLWRVNQTPSVPSDVRRGRTTKGKKRSSETGSTAALGVWLLSRDSEDGPDILDVFTFVQTRTETFFLTTSAGFYSLTRPNGRRLRLTDA